MRLYTCYFQILGLMALLLPEVMLAHVQIPINGNKEDKCVSLVVLQSDSTSYIVSIKVNSLNDSIIEYGGDVYHSLSLDDDACLNAVGEPALPVITQSVGLPFGKTYEAEVVEEVWTEIQIGKICPAQQAATAMIPFHDFKITSEVYSKDVYPSPLLSRGRTMTWRNVDNVRLTLCPFRYYPNKGRLGVLSECTLKVYFTPNKNCTEKKEIDARSLRGMFDNENFASSSPSAAAVLQNIQNSREALCTDYLIIVGNIPEIENSEQMKRFRYWKSLKGYQTKLVSTAAIGSDSASIKNYIQQEADNGVQQVLFVGNYDKIPLVTLVAKQYNIDSPFDYSDYWYGCLDGVNDVQAEIPIGRFTTNTLESFTNMVNKTIKYESQPRSWSDRVLLVASKDDAPTLFQNPIDAIANGSYYNTIDFVKAYGADSILGGNNATRSRVFNHANSGINMMINYSHGNNRCFWGLTSEMGQDWLSFADTCYFDSETNFVCIDMACYQGAINRPPNIATCFMNSDHCASAFLGCSVPSYIVADNCYLEHFPQLLFNENEVRLGHLNLLTQLWSINHCTHLNPAIDNALSFICGGDPSLEIWTGRQKCFQNVKCSLSSNNILSITLDGANGYRVNVVSENGVLIGKYEATGNQCSIPEPNQNCDILIDRHNYIPYLIHFDYDSNYIQDESIEGHAVYSATPINVGYDVTETKQYGNVVIQPQAKVLINKGNGVCIKDGFECKLGAELTIE